LSFFFPLCPIRVASPVCDSWKFFVFFFVTNFCCFKSGFPPVVLFFVFSLYSLGSHCWVPPLLTFFVFVCFPLGFFPFPPRWDRRFSSSLRWSLFLFCRMRISFFSFLSPAHGSPPRSCSDWSSSAKFTSPLLRSVGFSGVPFFLFENCLEGTVTPLYPIVSLYVFSPRVPRVRQQAVISYRTLHRRPAFVSSPQVS